MLIISDISVKCGDVQICQAVAPHLASAYFRYVNMITPHTGCLILPGLHSGRWYSAITQINMLCSEAHFSNIHTHAINMNWWSRNCKACNPAQNSSSDRYPTLPFITKSSKLLDGREMSYFAQFFFLLPAGIKFNFPPKVAAKKRK